MELADILFVQKLFINGWKDFPGYSYNISTIKENEVIIYELHQLNILPFSEGLLLYQLLNRIGHYYPVKHQE